MSRYSLAAEHLLDWELNAKAGLEMVGRAGFKSFGFTLRAEPATSLSRYGLTTECLLGLVLRWWVVQDLNPSDLPYELNLQPAYQGMA
ncbi:hypothetical protein [Providencia rettgeri]|uniref:hypothetical protein n=1 Tax=Providencia rettgeri TaxID=587 RepID=UPI001B35ABD0|nr:hypothetical protein [Providencia rettgeri]